MISQPRSSGDLAISAQI